MKNLFVPYEIAKQLKEKGFDQPCFALYRNKEDLKIEYHSYLTHDKIYISVPLYPQVVDWFREKHKIYIGVQLTGNTFKQEYLPYTINKLNPNNTLYFEPCKDYYESLTKSIEEALELIS